MDVWGRTLHTNPHINTRTHAWAQTNAYVRIAQEPETCLLHKSTCAGTASMHWAYLCAAFLLCPCVQQMLESELIHVKYLTSGFVALKR